MTEDDGSRRKINVTKKDWTTGSTTRNLWALSWPLMVSSTVMMIGPIIDTVWIGKLGTVSMAGVGVSTIIIMLINSLIFGLFTGLRALIARFVGAGDAKGANHVAQQALVISIALSILMAAIGILFAEPI